MEERTSLSKDEKNPNKVNNPGMQSNSIMLVYRWMIFIFSAILSITSNRFEIQSDAILESLAVVAIYNGVATAYYLNTGKKFSANLLYVDIISVLLLILFTGGLQSDLYVFLIFLIGLCGIYNDFAGTMKAGVISAIVYTATCIFSGRYNTESILYSTLVIRDLLFLMAAFAISRINFEVKKYDELRKREFRLARTDRLTGLANRHYFDQKVKEEVEYAISNNTVLNVLMFDLDNFKGFNDTYGHLSGDKLLMLFSDIIRQCVRKSDIPIRYGGEEFMILIRDMDIIIAKSVGDRIRRQLEKQRIYLGPRDEQQKVTVSCGVAQYPRHAKEIKDVIEKADQALYHAKAIGKNIVVTYDEIDQPREAIEREPLRIAGK